MRKCWIASVFMECEPTSPLNRDYGPAPGPAQTDVRPFWIGHFINTTADNRICATTIHTKRVGFLDGRCNTIESLVILAV